jgi:hypothetical protein
VASASGSPAPSPTPVYTAVPVSLKDAVADGDIDFVNKRAHIIGGMPGLPGLSGELMIMDPFAYFRGYGQTLFTGGDDSTLPINPALPSGPLYIVQQVVTVANDASLNPVLVGTEQEPSGSCYHIRVDVSQKALNSTLASQPAVQALGSGELDLWITYGDFQLERLEYTTSDPNAGAAAVRLVLSNWNSVSPIDQPAENQVATPAAT